MSTSKLNKILTAGASIAVLAAVTGCIENDIPYARIQPNFTEFVIEGETEPCAIDSATRTVTAVLGEEVDIYNVKVDSYALTEGAYLDNPEIFDSPIDLSEPFTVGVSLYQSYEWTITATQSIERYFSVKNQIGASTIDVPGHRVVAYVPETVDLAKIRVESLKLGSTNATYSPDIEGKDVDFSQPVEISVTDYGRTVTWTIYLETTESSVATLRVDAWTNVAWVYGEAEAGRDNGVEYRLATASDWTRIPADQVTYNGGSFTGCIMHLMAETEYVARTYSDDEFGAEIEFTTGGNVQLPNESMDDWWLDGKVWCPWAQGGTPYWGTGNQGAATLGQSNSVPTTDTSSGTGHAAKLETRFVGIGMLGKLAAGNVFVGRFVRVDGTNGVISMGRPFTEFPTKVTGFMKYHSAPISHYTAAFSNLKDRPDSCSIWCALIDSDEPYEIRTNPNNRRLFDPNGPEVIAYGTLEIGYDVTAYTPFEVKFNYVATNRRPKYIIVAASASKYGDYFTGGAGSVLYVDDFQLQYDY